jgi:hypothetical protein
MRTGLDRKGLKRKCSCFFYPVLLPMLFALILLPSMASIEHAHAAQILLEWDEIPHPGIAGYKVYYGVASGVYGFAADVGRSTACIVAGLNHRRTYFFAIAAYDSSGIESKLSTEISHFIS